ncbi:unnamed protein product [Amoebophrya sp. A25]|nr:unnamed protein product [Amoebophrya sp. A25]|eukprot:GSA25T00016724001.1
MASKRPREADGAGGDDSYDRCIFRGNLIEPDTAGFLKKTKTDNADTQFFKCFSCDDRVSSSFVQRWFHAQKKVRIKRVCDGFSGRFICPKCHLRKLDQFHPILNGALPLSTERLTQRSEACMKTSPTQKKPPEFQLSEFLLDRAKVVRWLSCTVDNTGGVVAQKDKKIHLRCVRCDEGDFAGPYWPNKVIVSVENRPIKHTGEPLGPKQINTINPPQMGHCRKEPLSVDLTPAILMSLEEEMRKKRTRNLDSVTGSVSVKVDMVYSTEIEQEDGPPPTAFALAPYLVRPTDWLTLKKKTLTILRTTQTPDPRERIQNSGYFIEQTAAADDDIEVTGDNVEARSIRLVDELTGCTMQTPVVGVFCRHLQCFDLDAFLQLQLQQKNAGQRWRCPICKLRCRPWDLRFCRFTKEIIDKATRLSRAKAGDGANDDEELDFLDEEFQCAMLDADGRYSFDYKKALQQERQGDVLCVDEDEEDRAPQLAPPRLVNPATLTDAHEPRDTSTEALRRGVPPSASTVPPAASIVPPPASTVPPTVSTVPPPASTVPPCVSTGTRRETIIELEDSSDEE